MSCIGEEHRRPERNGEQRERETNITLPAGLLRGRVGAQAVDLVVDAGVLRVTVAEPAGLDGAST